MQKCKEKQTYQLNFVKELKAHEGIYHLDYILKWID